MVVLGKTALDGGLVVSGEQNLLLNISAHGPVDYEFLPNAVCKLRPGMTFSQQRQKGLQGSLHSADGNFLGTELEKSVLRQPLVIEQAVLNRLHQQLSAQVVSFQLHRLGRDFLERLLRPANGSCHPRRPAG